MSSNNYKFCEICRFNHDQGRKHIYSSKHKEKLKQILQKFRSKVKKAKESLKDPQVFNFKANEDISLQFWCYMCQKEIPVHTLCGDVVVANSGMISHLASVEHYKSLGRFCYENKLTKEEKGRLMLTEDYINRFSEILSKSLVKFESSEEFKLQTEAAKIKHKEVKNEPAMHIEPLEWKHHLPQLHPITFTPYQNALQQAMCLKSSHQESSTSEPLAISQRRPVSHKSAIITKPSSATVAPSNSQTVPSQSATMPEDSLSNTSSQLTNAIISNHYDSGLIVSSESQSHSSLSNWQTPPKFSSLPSASSSGLTNIRQNPEIQAKLLDAGNKFGGNIHSGAVPPWLRNDDNDEKGSVTIGPTEEDFRKHLKSEAKKKLNPKRVGANFDRSLVTGDNWLPSFGRVWNFGRRKQSRDYVNNESLRNKRRKYNIPLEKDPLI